MKKTLSILMVIALLSTLAISVSAATIAFNPCSDEEQNYIYDDSLSSIEGDNIGRFHDADRYIIYEFPFEAGDAYAQLSIRAGAQYEISASKDAENFDIIAERERGEEDTEPNWKNGKFDELTLDLSAYLKDNTSGKIYIMVGDCDKTAGWGGYLSSKDTITFVSSPNEIVAETEAPATEAPATEAPVADDETPATTETPSAPDTADMGIIAAAAILAVAAGVVVASKKR